MNANLALVARTTFCAEHGANCDGMCAEARWAYLAYLERNPQERPADSTTTITLDLVHAYGEEQRYTVVFEGPDAEAWAIAYVTPRRSTHAIYEAEDAPFSCDAFPRFTAVLYPTCEHGGLARECYGPGHYMDAAQEQAMGWAYMD